ncbi:MAG: hypothetical protein RIN56_13130 [Sporomusaceae bacterium]|nr:hypothetical protein [Sporomusaceae bacterium]
MNSDKSNLFGSRGRRTRSFHPAAIKDLRDQFMGDRTSESDKNPANSNYREAMSRAAVDNEFIADTKEVEQDFASDDAEVISSSNEAFPQYANKPKYGRDENGFFRLYEDGRKTYCREKRIRVLSHQPLNPPLEAIQTTIKRAIAEIHANGLTTAHCDKRGRCYLRYPDRRKQFCKSVISTLEEE